MVAFEKQIDRLACKWPVHLGIILPKCAKYGDPFRQRASFFLPKTNMIYQNEIKIKIKLLIGNQLKLIFIHKEM